MSLETTLICEYIFNKNERVEYLICIGIKYTKYEHIYDSHYYIKHTDKKKQIQIINCMQEPDLTEYTNLMKVNITSQRNINVHLPVTIVYLKLDMSNDQKTIRIPHNVIQ
jgi:hypothetical protein